MKIAVEIVVKDKICDEVNVARCEVKGGRREVSIKACEGRVCRKGGA